MTVLDSSAVLAWIYREDGHERVAPHLATGTISSVNWAETLQKITWNGGDADQFGEMLRALGLVVHAFGVDDARATAALYPAVRSAGLSLGDRACLALARRMSTAALTADKAWNAVGEEADVDVQVIR